MSENTFDIWKYMTHSVERMGVETIKSTMEKSP